MKAPHGFMQGLITIVLLVYFGFAMFGKSFWPGFDVADAMAQTLINLVILGVGFYLGSSSNSQKKDDVIADQAKSAAPPKQE